MDPASTSPARAARIVYLALIGGVVGATVVFSLVRPVASGPAAPILVYIPFAMAVPLFAGALLLAGRLPRPGSTADPDAWWRANLPRALTIWAMLEGPSLYGAVVWPLTDSYLPLAVIAVGLFLFSVTAPRRLMEG